MKWSTTSSVLMGVLVAAVGVAAFMGERIERQNTETQILLMNEIKQIRVDLVVNMNKLISSNNDMTIDMAAELQQLQKTVQAQAANIRALQTARVGQPPAPPPSQRVTLPVREAYVLGNEDAPITMVEFIDFQCPFCKRFADDTFVKLKKEYIDTGKLRYISRNLPLAFHGQAKEAAQAAQCAGDQNKFWPMRQTLLDNSRDLSSDSIRRYAKDNSLNMKKFKKCLAADKYSDLVEQDLSDANNAGITGTPSFVVGTETEDGIEGIKIVGAVPFSIFDKEIKRLLEEGN